MSYRSTTRTTLLLAVALAFFAAACSDKQDVGKGIDTGVKGKLNELSTTTTVDPNVTTTTVKVNAINTTAPAATPKPTAAPVTTGARQTTTTADVSFPVGINSDNSGKNQIDPNQIGPIRVGGKVRFTNNDTKVRSIVSQDGGFRSPDLQPGQSWVFTATKPSSGTSDGSFHLIDGTRSYVTATMQVV